MVDYQKTTNLVTGTVTVSGVEVPQILLTNPGDLFISSNKDSISLIKGTPVSGHASGTGFIRGDNGAVATAAYGLLAEDAAIGFAKTIFIGGTFVIGDWTLLIGQPNLAPKAFYYLGASGTLTATAPTTPGQIVQLIGRAMSPVALDVFISVPILL